MVADPDDGSAVAASPLHRAALETSRSILALQRRSDASLLEAKFALEEQTRELRRSVSLLNATLESSPFGIAAFDQSRRLLAYNKRYAALWGFPPELLATRDGESLMNFALGQVADARWFSERFGRLDWNSSENDVDSVALKDGRTFERHLSPQRLDGRIVGVVVAWRDVSEARAASQALHDSQQRMQALFDHAISGLLLLDDDGRCVDANPAACQMLGHDRESLQCRRLFAGGAGLCKHDGGDDPWTALMRDRRQHGEACMRRGDGTTIDVDYGAVADVQPGVHLWTFSDATERRKADEFRVAKEVAEAASQAKSAFLSRMSHELRTPLNAILGLSEVMQLDRRHPLRGPQGPNVERIRTAGAHLLALIDDILDVARIESGSMRIELEDIDAGEVAREVVRNLRVLADRHDVTVALDNDTDPGCRAYGDRTRLKQVLWNLVSNAIKYNRAGGWVKVSCAAAHGRQRIHVRDNGIGMNEAQRLALFQPFNRLGREASPVRGTGIGLVITRNLVELLGGTLTVSSHEGGGSEFVVELRGAETSKHVTGRPASTRPRPRTDLRGTVLYIDDDEINRVLMQAFVALRPGVELRLAVDGLSGIAAAAETPLDLILVDIRLPDMHGTEVLRAIRQDAHGAGPPCVAVSAEAMPEEVQAALAAGFDGYLTKPLAAAVLLAELDRRLG